MVAESAAATADEEGIFHYPTIITTITTTTTRVHRHPACRTSPPHPWDRSSDSPPPLAPSNDRPHASLIPVRLGAGLQPAAAAAGVPGGRVPRVPRALHRHHDPRQRHARGQRKGRPGHRAPLSPTIPQPRQGYHSRIRGNEINRTKVCFGVEGSEG